MKPVKPGIMFMKREDAIKKLTSSKEKYVCMAMIDYDHDKLDDTFKKITISNGVEMIEDAISIVYNPDFICSCLDLYSVKQTSLRKLIRKGNKKTLIFLN